MPEEVYRQLAQRLDTVPNGFPATESGVELELLARLFTPQEAALACAMRLTPEPAADIAVRAGTSAAVASDLLDGMARKELIRAHQDKDQRTYRLQSRLAGTMGTRMILQDPELATLFEQYYQETRGISLEYSPASYRVIPVQESIPVDLQIHPYEQVVTMLESAKSWGVRECICRLQQHAIGKNCGHPVEVCLVLWSTEGAFDGSEIDRAISKEEALTILKEAENAGMVHTTMNYGREPFNICNCCTCSCGILRGVAEFGIPTAVARSDFYSVVDVDLCNGCSDCVGRCSFDALSVREGIARVDRVRCVGCGLCTTVCSTGALRLERRPPGENPPIPSDFSDWMSQFADSRSMPPSEVS
jgi:electron transport complex protein RnfB